jgi:hypothetical protein
LGKTLYGMRGLLSITHSRYSPPRTLRFYDRQYRYEVKQLNKELGNGRK